MEKLCVDSFGSSPVSAVQRNEERFRLMLRVRRFEETIVELSSMGEIPGPVHDYSGQEAVAVGVLENLRPDDLIASTHRGHGHGIARGVGVRPMLAELMARENGLNHGRGGSMHVADLSRGILGANGMVGAGAPIVTGATWAARQQGRDVVGVAFFGDGAVNQGVFLETLNLAAVWKVPILFVCENNGLAITTRATDSTAGSLDDRARGFGLDYVAADGMDVEAVAAVAREAYDRVRETLRPVFIELETYRYNGHSSGERFLGLKYRTDEEVETWRGRDPIVRARRLIEEDRANMIASEVDEEIDDALAFARSSPLPEPDTALDFMYAQYPEGSLI